MTGYILFFYFWAHISKAPTMTSAHFGTQAACIAAGNELVDKVHSDQIRSMSVWFRCIPDGKVQK